MTKIATGRGRRAVSKPPMARRSLIALPLLVAACGAPARLPAAPIIAQARALPPPPPAAARLVVSAGVLRGQLAAGPVTLAVPSGVATTTAVLLCVDPDGMTALRAVEVGRDAAFADAVRAGLAGLAFTPWAEGGQAVEVCALVAVTRAAGAREVELLPAAERLLPPPVVALGEVTLADVAQPSTPGVAVVERCVDAAGGAPTAALLQTSGDAAVDAGLLYARISRPPAPRPGDASCGLVTAVVGAAPLVAQPALVEPTVADPQRVAGRVHVFPAVGVRDQIALRRGPHATELTIGVRLCAAASGRVERVELLSSSGFRGYDLDLLNAVAAWRYRAAADGGLAPLCTVVHFSYRQRD